MNSVTFYVITSPSAWLVSVWFALSAASAAVLPATDSPEAVAFFEKNVHPMLIGRCYLCHSAETKNAGGLRVDDLNGLLSGGNSGPAIIPGNAEKSLLLQRTRDTSATKIMPQEGEHVTDEEYADLAAWINAGAAWPKERLPEGLGILPKKIVQLKNTHWAWQPLRNPKLPVIKDDLWPNRPVDHFILAQLEEHGVPPVADASPEIALRRLHYDLTGLPPSPEEIHTFINDPSETAWTAIVDRLLDSRAFAEKWGRHWLDVARYAESTGPSRNIPYPHAWRYRNYVIDSIAWDVPFNRFIQEQLAGDLIPAFSAQERDRLATATGFLSLGVKDVNQRFKERFQMDNVDEKIDVTTRAFLGLTVSCARCHDHKTDPIPAQDYYALAGIFTSTEDGAGVRNLMGGGGLAYYVRDNLIPLHEKGHTAPAEAIEKKKAEVVQAKKEWDAIRGTPEGMRRLPNGQFYQRRFRLKYERLETELQNLSDPVAQGYAVHGVREAVNVGDTPIRVRGEAERLGPSVSRGFLSTFEVPGTTSVNREQSGRLELAQWLSSSNNPLTPRVFANRVWKHLFGEGLVSTVDNFGITGDTPSHPELLDHLASRLIAEGWSLKKLVRELTLTRAYRLGTEAPESHLEKDPANRLVWRHSPRRLDAEEIRDTLLLVSSRLDHTPPQDSPARQLPMIEMSDTSDLAKNIRIAADQSRHRSVYLPLLRGVTPPTLEAFDPVGQTLVTGKRDATTVPTQALFLLNSPFVREQALALAESVLATPNFNEELALRQLYQRVLGRDASNEEFARAQHFLSDFETTYPSREKEEIIVPPTELTPVVATTDAVTVENEETEEGSPQAPSIASSPPLTEPSNPRTAAWMALTQSLFGSAEFRFVR